MSKKGLPHPTDTELAILQVLWGRGPSTVRDVHEALSHNRTTGYTTTLKLMQIMAEKGLVTRDESRRTHIYEAAGNQDRTRQQLVRKLLDRAFEGSAKNLVMQALSTNEASAEELTEIRNLLDSLERNLK
jgi:BlaI family penicillinase repressor